MQFNSSPQPRQPSLGPHGRPIDYMTGCEQPPAFYQALSPAVTSVTNPGVTEPVSNVLLDGEIGTFPITRHGGFPTPTIKATYSSVLRSRTRHPDPAEFGFGPVPGVQRLHAVRLREISIPDNLPNVRAGTNDRLYINTMAADMSFNLLYQNFVCRVPTSNYLSLPILLAEVDNALSTMRYYEPGKGLEADHGDATSWLEHHAYVRPLRELTTVFDEKSSIVGIASYGKRDDNRSNVGAYFYNADGTTSDEYDTALEGHMNFVSHTVRAEETTSRQGEEVISDLTLVDVSVNDAFDISAAISNYSLRFLEFKVNPGQHNLAVGDRVEIHDVSLADVSAGLASTSGLAGTKYVSYVLRGQGSSTLKDTLRVYLYTKHDAGYQSTDISLGASPKIVILDKCEANIGPMLGFRHHTRLGIGCKVRGGEHLPIVADEACVTRGVLKSDRTPATTNIQFKAIASPLLPPQTYDKSRFEDESNSDNRFKFDYTTSVGRQIDLQNLQEDDGASLLVLNGAAPESFRGDDYKVNSAVFGLNGLDTLGKIRSPNHIVVDVGGLVVDSIDDILSNTVTNEIHVYPEAYWGWQSQLGRVEDTVRGTSDWALTFGLAAASLSRLNQFAFVRLTRNGQQLGNIVCPQGRRTGNTYFAKVHFDRLVDGGMGRTLVTATGGVHVFPQPVREVGLGGSDLDPHSAPSELYVIELFNQNEQRLNVRGHEWDLILEFVNFR